LRQTSVNTSLLNVLYTHTHTSLNLFIFIKIIIKCISFLLEICWLCFVSRLLIVVFILLILISLYLLSVLYLILFCMHFVSNFIFYCLCRLNYYTVLSSRSALYMLTFQLFYFIFKFFILIAIMQKWSINNNIISYNFFLK